MRVKDPLDAPCIRSFLKEMAHFNMSKVHISGGLGDAKYPGLPLYGDSCHRKSDVINELGKRGDDL